MTANRPYRFTACQALTPAGQIIDIPEGTFLVARTDVVSIAVHGRIQDIASSSFELLQRDHKATEAEE